MKRTYILLVAAFVSAGTASAVSFRDVASNHPFATAISFMRSAGIINGYNDGTFRPDNTVNRAEFVKMVIGATANSEDIRACTDVSSFRDVKSSDWFAMYLCVAHRKGVIEGYSDGTFQGIRTMNFAEAAKIVVEAAGIEHRTYAFVWYRPYTDALSHLQAVPASITDPSHLMTRAEIAELLYRLRDVLHLREQSYSSTSVQSGTMTKKITVGNRERSYVMHIPANVKPNPALVLVFHGGNTTAEIMQSVTGFDEKANQEGFIVVYPQGIDDSWNDGRGTSASARQNIDDVYFVQMLIAQLKRDVSIDANRIYATGASNGGIFTQLLGCKMADVFAAIAPVIGSIATNELDSCSPSQPLSVVMIQGTDDPYIPYEGGEVGWKSGKGEGGQLASAEETLALWTRKNGCNSPRTTNLATHIDDGTSVTKIEYASCKEGTETVLYKVNGGGHVWYPNSPNVLSQIFIKPGISSKNIDDTDVITKFFLSHTK